MADALRTLGMYDPSEAPSADEYATAAFKLNLLCKELVVDGAAMWLRKSRTLFLQDEQESYLLGPSGDHWTASYVETELASDASSGATSITVDSATGITSGYNIGVKQDDGSIHWTTVSGAPVGTTVTLASALTDDAAADNKVYVYQSKAQRPETILIAYRRDYDDIDTEIMAVGRTDYDRLSQKNSAGVPTTIHYNPSLTNGTLFVWPTQPTQCDKLILVVREQVQDFDVGADNPDFPVEWSRYLVYALACDLADNYGRPLSERGYLRNKAEAAKQRLLDYSMMNDESVRFTIDYRGR